MKYGSREKWLNFLLYLVVIVMINLLSGTLFFRLDLTENKSYSLSGASKNLVASLEEPLTVRAFLSENLPQPYNNLEQQMRDLLEEYSLEGNRNFNYSLYMMDQEGTATDEGGRNLRDMAGDYNIPAIQIQNVEQDEVKLQTAYMGMVLVQGDLVETIPALANERNLEYRITSVINKISRKTSTMLAMSEKIQVKLILSPELIGFNSELSQYSSALKKLIDRLNSENFGKIEYGETAPASLTRDDLNKYGLNTISLKSGTESNPITTKAYAGVVVQYGDESSSINLLNQGIFGYSMTSVSDLEQPIGEMLEKLIGVNQSIAYLSSHGTPALYSNPYAQQQGASAGNFNQLLSEDYNIKNVTLDNIPGDIRTLIINGPSESFSAWELFQIDQFIMNGGSVAFFIDTYIEIMPSQQEMQYGQMPRYEPLNTGLEKLTSRYGAELIPSYVMDENCYVQQQRNAFGSIEETPIYFAPMIDQQYINNDISFMKNIKGLIVLNISPLEIRATEESGITASTLFSSSKTSWTVSENINLYNPAGIYPPSSDDRGTQDLAVLLEGELPSYFEGKPIPARPQIEGEIEGENAQVSFGGKGMSEETGFINKATAGRVFVTAGSAIMADNVLDAAGVSPNAMLVRNMIDYLNGREDYAIMRSKGQGYNPLEDVDPGTKAFLKGVNIVFLPILTVLLGLIMWVHWKERKKKIARMFSGEKT